MPQTPHLPKVPPPLPPSPLLATQQGIQISCFPACLPVFFPFPKVRAEECRLNPLSGGGTGMGWGWLVPSLSFSGEQVPSTQRSAEEESFGLSG